jgi:hypothetical protein
MAKKSMKFHSLAVVVCHYGFLLRNLAVSLNTLGCYMPLTNSNQDNILSARFRCRKTTLAAVMFTIREIRKSAIPIKNKIW